MSTSTALKIIVASTALVLLILAFFFNNQKSGPFVIGKLGGNFTLNSSTGSVSLSDYQGKTVVIYMGYISCPDVCPTSLGIITQAFRSLNQKEQAQVAGLFISLDPERDSLEKLQTFSAFFHPNITGITGTETQLKKVARQYGAFYQLVDTDDSALKYVVDHTARIYVINSLGELSAQLPYNTSATELLSAIRASLAE